MQTGGSALEHPARSGKSTRSWYTSGWLGLLGIFVAGLLTVAQFSFWGNYLPLVYPVHLRGTGESFAANIGEMPVVVRLSVAEVSRPGYAPRPLHDIFHLVPGETLIR